MFHDVVSEESVITPTVKGRLELITSEEVLTTTKIRKLNFLYHHLGIMFAAQPSSAESVNAGKIRSGGITTDGRGAQVVSL